MKCWLLAQLTVAALLLTIHSSASAQTGPDFSTLKADHTAAVAAIIAGADKQRASLYDNYAAALDTPAKEATAKGNLEALLAIKKEQETARKERRTGTAPMPDIASYRALLQKALTAIESKSSQETAALNLGYVRKLEVLKTALTRANRIDEAVGVDAEMKSLQGQAVADNLPASLGVKLDGTSPILTEVTALVGLHKPKHRVQIGGEDPKDKKKAIIGGVVTSRPGTIIDDANIFIRYGDWKGEGTLFRRCKLEAELGGKWTLSRSLLDDCTLSKGGGWVVNLWSSQWIFDNCAFTRSFMLHWETHHMGVKATHCTFHDVNFASVKYKDDAGKEAANEWMTFKDCKFINCSVPETLLMATKDCVFEDCRFERDKGDLPGDTPIKVKLYAPPLTTLPAARKGITYEMHNPKERTDPAGATIRYSKLGGDLQF